MVLPLRKGGVGVGVTTVWQWVRATMATVVGRVRRADRCGMVVLLSDVSVRRFYGRCVVADRGVRETTMRNEEQR